MRTAETLEISHSWPLFELPRHFEMGWVLSCAVTDIIEPTEVGGLGIQHAGFWECDLSNNSLIWSGGVYDLFGLPRNANISRDEAVSFYCEESRAAMERLRYYAIKHRRGFTLDAEIQPAVGERRWMRLIGAPSCNGDQVTHLHGLKLLI